MERMYFPIVLGILVSYAGCPLWLCYVLSILPCCRRDQTQPVPPLPRPLSLGHLWRPGCNQFENIWRKRVRESEGCWRWQGGCLAAEICAGRELHDWGAACCCSTQPGPFFQQSAPATWLDGDGGAGCRHCSPHLDLDLTDFCPGWARGRSPLSCPRATWRSRTSRWWTSRSLATCKAAKRELPSNLLLQSECELSTKKVFLRKVEKKTRNSLLTNTHQTWKPMRGHPHCHRREGVQDWQCAIPGLHLSQNN